MSAHPDIRKRCVTLVACLPNMDLVDAHTVRFAGDLAKISRFIEMTPGYPPTMNQ